jgi:hypothetical protein
MSFYIDLLMVAIVGILGSMQIPVIFMPIFIYGLYKIYLEYGDDE